MTKTRCLCLCSSNHPGTDVCTGTGGDVVALKILGKVTKVQLCLDCAVATLQQERVNVANKPQYPSAA